MTKPTHQHQEDTRNTDAKFSPDDEHLYTREKQEFQQSEKAKKDEGEPQKSSQDSDETDEK